MADVPKLKIALVQMAVGADKAANLRKAVQAVREASRNGANIVTLPECFNSPYGCGYFEEYAEQIPEQAGEPGPEAGESCKALSEVAKECKVFLVGGSIPERSGEKLYNTSMSFGRDGRLLGIYRKAGLPEFLSKGVRETHLFDIDIPGRQTFKESDVLSPGNKLLAFDTDWCKVGIGICYDLRFPELASLYALKGCKLLLYPGAFNLTTGPLHWELLLRSLALNYQLFVAGVSPARDMNATYKAWGHTTLCNPWGEVIATCDSEETTLYADIDLAQVDSVRTQIPVTSQKRWDLFSITDKTES